MSRYHSYLNTSKEIIGLYKGQEPLSSFLKKYFSANKRAGSKDRKAISHLCYCYFRLGKAAAELTTEERILAGLFLCSTVKNEILETWRPAWNEKVHVTVQEKLSIIGDPLLLTTIFPWKHEVSTGIDHDKFCASFLVQPDVFLRARPGHLATVTRKLQLADPRSQPVGENSFALPNASKLENVFEIDKEVVIQDLNSQRTGKFIGNELRDQRPGTKVWDCCAGSGGKSIMAFDSNPSIDLTVTDARESILANLKKRFEKAGIRHYTSFVVDLLSGNSKIRDLNSKIIICDAPCTGSGTWARTPEQLYFFKETEIEKFSALQKKIVSNVLPQLETGGSFIYITCSVFKKENEVIVDYMKNEFGLQYREIPTQKNLPGGLILKGYEEKADTMFVVVMEKL